MQVGKSIFGTDADSKPTKAAPRAAAPAPSPTKAAAVSKPSASTTSKAEAPKPSAATESAKPAAAAESSAEPRSTEPKVRVVGGWFDKLGILSSAFPRYHTWRT